MHRSMLTVLATLLSAAAPPASAPPAPSTPPSPGEIVAHAPATAWRMVDPADLLLMTLANGRTVAIELAPGFAPVHVANIRALARGGWFDGSAVERVQDNYVTQWGRDNPKATLPPGVVAHPPAEYDRPAPAVALRPLGSTDNYARTVGHADGWPVASDGRRTWLTHCYGMVGVGRDMPPDTGNGAELYAVIGQAPRHLDRNIALVGRVVDGMDALTALPRGTADLGFYAEAGQRLAIRSVRIAADLPAAARPAYQVLRSDAPTFAAYVAARANRRDAFFVQPAGAVDLCNAPVPVRRAP
jgi:peptidylprolyl isomerase